MTRGIFSGSGSWLQVISSGISSRGGDVRIFLGFGSAAGSDKHRLARSWDSCVKFIGAFHAAIEREKNV